MSILMAATGKIEIMESDASDPVVREIDVYIAHPPHKQTAVYMLQFPLRPPWRPYDEQDLKAVQIRPVQKSLQMQYSIETESPFHSGEHYKAERLQTEEEMEVDQAMDDSGDTKPEEGYNRFSLRSSYVPLDNAAYAIGRLDQDGTVMYLFPVDEGASNVSGVSALTAEPSAAIDQGDADGERPIKPVHGGVMQMRPQFDHLNPPAAPEEEEGAEESSTAAAVQVTFTRKEKDSVLRAKQRSHSYMTHLEDTEEWVPLAFSHLNSVETSEAITAWQTTADQGDGVDEDDLDIEALMSSGYLDELGGIKSRQSEEDAKMLSDILKYEDDDATAHLSFPPWSLELLQKGLPLHVLVGSLMMSARILSLDMIREVLKTRQQESIDEDALIDALVKHCLLVQGNWVIKSELCYPFKPEAQTTRNTVLCFFERQTEVRRKDIAEKCATSPSSFIHTLLLEVAKLSRDSGAVAVWELKLPTDNNFARRYPRIAHKQESMWHDLWNNICEGKPAVVDSGAPVRKSIPSRRNEPAKRPSSTAAASDKVSDSLKQIKALTREEGKKAETGPDPYADDTSMPPKERTERAVLRALRSYGLLSLESLRSAVAEEVALKKIAAFPSDISPFMDDILKRVAQVISSNGGKDVFVRKRAEDDALNRYRDVVLELFKGKEKVKRGEINKAMQEALGRAISAWRHVPENHEGICNLSWVVLDTEGWKSIFKDVKKMVAPCHLNM